MRRLTPYLLIAVLVPRTGLGIELTEAPSATAVEIPQSVPIQPSDVVQ